MIFLKARAKAFSGEGVRLHKFMVEDGIVRVFDSIAGHYTRVHSLSVAAILRILKMAERGV